MLIGNNVALEEIDPTNIEWMREQRNNPEMRQYFREWKDITKDQQQKWYSSRGNNSDPNHVYFQIMAMPNVISAGAYLTQDELSIMISELGSWVEKPPTISQRIDHRFIIGCCGLHYVDWRLRSAEFGIFLAQFIRGKGLGKEALMLLFNYGFREMNLHKIWCEVYEGNESIHLYRKLGFRDEGILRDNYFHNGKYGNSVMMSVLEDEWFSLHGER